VTGGPALEGLRVADFSGGLAGPLAAMMLADHGADVFKVESVDRGDLTREVDPVMFLALNRNKRSLAVNLKDPRGLEAVRKLVAGLDVLIENFRPGVMDRLGLGPEAVRQLNPRLIYASFTGFGPKGPDSLRRAVDTVAQAETGLAGLNAPAGGPPTPIRLTVVDVAGGMALAQGVLAALIRRGRTGVGERVDANLLGSALFLQINAIAHFSLSGLEPRDAPPSGGPAQVYQAKDGPIYLATFYQNHFVAACRLLGLDELADDPANGNISLRAGRIETLAQRFAEKIAARTRAEWLPIFEEAGLLYASVKSYAETVASPQIELNESLFDLPVDAERTIKAVRLPYRLESGWAGPDRPPPLLGEHSKAILTELGLGDSTEELERDGVIVQP
jgi:crotonobetainyl-CoA:carnitine CoA-transferase CaiB-like acyl-CoA transferase